MRHDRQKLISVIKPGVRRTEDVLTVKQNQRLMKNCFLLIAFFCFTSANHQRQLTWIAIGDSITYLNDHLDETGNRVTKGYMTRVREKLPHIHYLNEGRNGWTSGNIAQGLDSLGLFKADIYSVFLGTNDWWRGRPLGSISDYKNNTGNTTVYGSFRIILDKLKILNPSARIILITPMQRSDFVYIANSKNNAWGSYRDKNGQTLKQFAEAIKTIGKEERFPVVDLYNKSGITQKNLVKFKRLKDSATGAYRDFRYPDFIGVPFNPDTDAYPYPPEAIDMTYDGLHPSDKGYEVIAKMLVKIMKRY
jgi:lysophospholipase L1-like esterase